MIDFKQVSKQFGGQIILDDVSFRVNTGERAGFVGPNGTGKSTIFALVAGEAAPDQGTVEIAKGGRLGYLRQQLREEESVIPLQTYVEQAAPDLRIIHDEIHRLEDNLTGETDPAARERALRRIGELQTTFEHRGGYDLHVRAATTLTGLGFPADGLDRPLREFSGGWQMRAELARALVADPDILLLDEPSNYLDLPAVEWLRRFLEQYRGTLAIISHDRYLLNALTETTYEVAGGMVTKYAGPYSWHAAERVNRLEQSQAAQRNQQRKREQIERFVERFRAKNTKASQVQSRIKMLEKMEDVKIPGLARGRVALRLPPPPHAGAEILRLDSVSFQYDASRWILRNVDLTIARGEKLAIVGSNGMGKTTLLRLLAGQLEPVEEKYVLGHKVVPGYQSQEFAETMDAALTAIGVLKAAAPDASEGEVRTLLGSFGFSGEAAEKTVTVLSGGEKIRLAFARLLIRPPNLLLLDEPTTHLDIEARETLQTALSKYAGTVLLVSHDVEFVRAVAEGVIAMAPPGIQRYAGGYDYYREKAAAEQVEEAAGQPDGSAERSTGTSKAQRRERAERRKELQRRTREIDRQIASAEKKIEKLEEEREALVAELAAPDTSAERRAEAGRELKHAEHQLGRVMHEWEEDSLRREQIVEELS